MAGTRFTPRPSPGELIRSDWMNRLADSVEELFTLVAGLEKRLQAVEKKLSQPQGGGGGIGGIKIRPEYLDLVEGFKEQLEEVTDPREKYKEIYQHLAQHREELFDLDPDDEEGGPRPEEILFYLKDLGEPATDAITILQGIDQGVANELVVVLEQEHTSPLAWDAHHGLLGGLNR